MFKARRWRSTWSRAALVGTVIVLLAVATIVGAGPASSVVPAHPRDSRDVPNVRTGTFLNVPVGTMLGTTAGHVGLGVLMGSEAYSGCTDNRPRYGVQDWAYGTCFFPYVQFQPNHAPSAFGYEDVYYWDYNTGQTDFPNGIVFKGDRPCRDLGGTYCKPGQTLHTDWPNKARFVRMELYAADPDVGWIFLQVPCCDKAADGGWYVSANGIGDVPFPSEIVSNTGRFGGSIKSTEPVAPGQVQFDIFGTGAAPRFTSTGVPLYAFASTSNGQNSLDASAWRSTYLYAGAYQFYLSDAKHHTHRVVAFANLDGTNQRFNLSLDAPCFGVFQPRDPDNVGRIMSLEECTTKWAQS